MHVDSIKLEPGEKILIQTRRHWFYIVSQIATVVALALTPPIIFLFINALLTSQIEGGVRLTEYAAQLSYFYFLILILSWILIFNLWTNYYLDLLIITDRRAILLNQKGFFWRNVASFRLERLQDMNVEVNGLIATMLDYGTIEVETAGNADEQFKAHHIPSPGHIKSIILQAADRRIGDVAKHDGIALE